MKNQALSREENHEGYSEIEEESLPEGKKTPKIKSFTKSQIPSKPVLKSIYDQTDDFIDLNESENNNNSVLKETDDASNPENHKNNSNDENNLSCSRNMNSNTILINNNKSDLREREIINNANKTKAMITKINNYLINSNSKSDKKANSNADHLDLNESTPSSYDKISISKTKLLQSAQEKLSINKNNNINNINNYSLISYEDLNNSCFQESTENQTNTAKSKRENFTLLPIETKYFKLSKDTRATHIPNIQDFECLACFHIVNDPKVCAECEKLICQDCLETWWSEKTNKEKECIHCKKTFYDLFMPRIVRNSLNSIVIKCPNKNGCKASFEYQYLQKHLEVCKFTKREAVCNFCKEVFATTNEKTEINAHLGECPLADIFCEYCHKTISRKKLQKHQAKCEKQFNRCADCGASLQICDMKNHSKPECVENIKRKFYEEIKEKDLKIIELAQYKKDYESVKSLNRLAPYFAKFLINKHKIKYEARLEENENFLRVIDEKFGINSENYLDLTKQELIYQYYDEIKSLSKNPVKIITSKKNYGKIYFENGNFYEGKLKQNLPNGVGELSKLIPFLTYKGEFKDGKFNGDGKYYYKDGARYSGGFLEDKKHGRGSLNMPNGHKYEGEFQNQTMTGFGTYTYENGTKYVGYFNNGVKHGEGCEYFGDGDLLFKGFYEKDKKNGYGVLFEKKTVKVFEGQFTNGKRNEEDAVFSSRTNLNTNNNNNNNNKL